MQVDSPQKLYNQPNNLFVAGFIGSPQMNFIDAECVIEGSKVVLNYGEFSVELPAAKAQKLIDGNYNGKKVVLGIRPEDIAYGAGAASVDTEVTGYELLGAEALIYCVVAGANVTARVNSDVVAKYGDKITLSLNPEKIHVFDKETELTITN